MYTVRSQPIFNPMQTTLFKRAHTGTCIDNGYDMNSMTALSNLFKLTNQGEPQTSVATVKNASTAESISSNDLLTNQTIISNLVSNTGMQSTLSNNHQNTTPTAVNLLDSLKTSSQSLPKCTNKSSNENLIYNFDKSALSFYPFEQLQKMSPNLFNLSNSPIDLARTFQLIAELSSKSSLIESSVIQKSTLPPTSISSSINSSFNSCPLIQKSSSNNQLTNRPTKRQKTIPNPIQLTYSNFNPINEQVQPLDLSIKSASSTNSERFILEPLNLSRSNSPEEVMQKSTNSNLNNNLNNSLNVNLKIDNSNLNIVQIQNALCKKKKIMVQRAAELLKKSSCSSAPCSPSSIATSSSPSDQPFDLDTSQSNQSNIEICLPTLKDSLNQLHKKRKFSDSSYSLDSQLTTNSLNSHQRPKLQTKRRQSNSSKKSQPRKLFLNITEETEMITSNNQEKQPSTIIIDAKNTYDCSICGEMFAFKDRLSKHVKSKHRNKLDQNDSKPISLSSTSQQSTGNGRNSPNQKSYECKICNRSFSRSDMLTRHSRVHSGDKPFSCDICESQFTRSDHLATHKRTHSGVKPYKCSKCAYRACRRDMINRHMKTHNNGDKKNSSNGVVLLIPGDKDNSISPSPLSPVESKLISSTSSQVISNESIEPNLNN